MSDDSSQERITAFIKLIKEVASMQIKSKSVHVFIVLVGLSVFLYALAEFAGKVAPNGFF